jgi:hypothetical protein
LSGYFTAKTSFCWIGYVSRGTRSVLVRLWHG